MLNTLSTLGCDRIDRRESQCRRPGTAQHKQGPAELQDTAACLQYLQRHGGSELKRVLTLRSSGRSKLGIGGSLRSSCCSSLGLAPASGCPDGVAAAAGSSAGLTAIGRSSSVSVSASSSSASGFGSAAGATLPSWLPTSSPGVCSGVVVWPSATLCIASSFCRLRSCNTTRASSPRLSCARSCDPTELLPKRGLN